MSKQYGPLMQLRFGSFPVVVGSSVKMARLCLKTHDLAISGRPTTNAGKHTAYFLRHHVVPICVAPTGGKLRKMYDGAV
ncbi:hypothetical protein HPP92_015572 [Vanilla planifolia]|uniref:Uncharacterized protein n=1 Tax=Vanilla planifolia TaxID=51239 RepID=A0A835UTE0_VANPL|nr:hypothetical protein HPP92_015572 [Vanilla planifolia]